MYLDAGHSVLLLLLLLHLYSKSKMKDFGGETPYSVMFGPDICGFGTRKTHVIFNYKEKNHLVKKDIKCETDQLSHVYTLRLMPNNTYEVRTCPLACEQRRTRGHGQTTLLAQRGPHGPGNIFVRLPA
jgi:hypothetical protein